MTGDQVQILLVAAGCAVGVGVLGLLAAWTIRHRSIVWQLALIVVVAIGSALAGIVAISRLMFISPHDREVVTIVMAASGVVAVLVALAVGAAISGGPRPCAATPVGSTPTGRTSPRSAAPASCRRCPRSWPARARGSRSRGSVRSSSSPRVASSCRGCRTTCAPRWPACGR